MQVLPADRQHVPIARHHPHVELGVGELDPRRDRGRASVDGVEAVGGHGGREAGRGADAGDEPGAVPGDAQLSEHLVHRLEDGVVAAAGAPPDLLVRGIVFGLELGVGDSRDGHGVRPPRIACTISATLNGLPSTLESASAGTRYAARKSWTSWPALRSRTRTRANRWSKSPRLRGNGFR